MFFGFGCVVFGSKQVFQNPAAFRINLHTFMHPQTWTATPGNTQEAYEQDAILLQVNKEVMKRPGCQISPTWPCPSPHHITHDRVLLTKVLIKDAYWGNDMRAWSVGPKADLKWIQMVHLPSRQLLFPIYPFSPRHGSESEDFTANNVNRFLHCLASNIQ